MGDSRWQDIRYAVRTLRRARGASLLIVATLAVVIAATTSILTVANRLLLRRAPRDRDPEGARAAHVIRALLFGLSPVHRPLVVSSR